MADSLVREDKPRFACVFFKANPAAWIEQNECLTFANTDLRQIVLRHHVLAKHQQLNDKLLVNDPRRIDPNVFADILAWSREGAGRNAPDHAIWQYMYEKIKGSEHRPDLSLDPYYTPVGLQVTLASVNADRASTAYQDQQALHREVCELASLRDDTRDINESLARTVQELSTITSRLQQLQRKVEALETARISQPSAHLCPLLGNNEATKDTGSIFAQALYGSGNALDDVMDEYHLDENDQGPFGSSMYKFVDGEAYPWPNQGFMHMLNPARDPSLAHLVLARAMGAPEHVLLSEQTVPVTTPTSSLPYGVSPGQHD